MDTQTIVVVGFFLFLAILLISIAASQSKKKPKLLYQKRTLFTRTEKEFLFVLDELFGDGYRVFGKIRVADVILPRSGLKREEWGRLFGKISSKHLDYVLADRTTLRPLCAIELNDKSHARKDRQERDRLIGEALASAGLPIVWVKQQKKYDKKALRDEVGTAIAFAKKQDAENYAKISRMKPKQRKKR
jgi:hypothetical protein